ncbi:hypothetical protein BHE74_00051945 [Ensete ventricosum]|nr:hypothetical protein BHE74_00051945 [Ensete ventricosum]
MYCSLLRVHRESSRDQQLMRGFSIKIECLQRTLQGSLEAGINRAGGEISSFGASTGRSETAATRWNLKTEWRAEWEERGDFCFSRETDTPQIRVIYGNATPQDFHVVQRGSKTKTT